MRRALVIPFVISLLIPVPPASSRELMQSVRLAVIVHPTRMEKLSPEDLVRIYLKKRRFWNDGEAIIALNQEPGSAARETFSQRILGSESTRLGSYWNAQYFQGVLPPVVLSSAAAVKRYVASDRNAVGYIELSEVDDSVHVMLRLE